jgi:hypothetical protein
MYTLPTGSVTPDAGWNVLPMSLLRPHSAVMPHMCVCVCVCMCVCVCVCVYV